MHTRTRVVNEGLGHKQCGEVLAQRDLFDDGSSGHDVVGSTHRIDCTQVDFVLTGATFVVRELDRNAHIFEHANRATTEIV